MKALLFLVSLLVAGCGAGPQTTVVKDKRGIVRAEVARVDGRKDGPVRFFREDGSLRLAGTYHNDARTGTWAAVDRKGDTLSLSHFKHGRKDGIQVNWSSGGQVVRVEQYANGWPEGPLYRFFPDGTPREMSNYSRGVFNGPYTAWFKLDSLHAAFAMGAYVQGKRQGLWTWSFSNGRPQAQGHYEHGAKVGAWTSWDREGRITLRTDHGKGKNEK